MKTFKVMMTLAALCLGLLSGCATPLSNEEISKLDYGSYPADYKQVVERHLDRVLKDPGSKQIEWLKGPGQMYNKAGALAGGGVIAGYGVCAYVNAKNSYGGYTGSKLSFFMIKNGFVVISYIATTKDSIESMMAENGCKAI